VADPTTLGPHIDPPLAAIPDALRAGGWRVFQTVVRDPRRLSKDGVPDEADRRAYANALAGINDLFGVAHASMLTSLGSPDPRIRNASASALAGDANLSAELGLAGVCFHVGYQKGHDTRDAALDAVARKLGEVIGKLKPGARVLLENGCEGTELGQTIAEVAYVARMVDAPVEALGVLLDTCHLHVSGLDLAAEDGAERFAGEIAEADLTDRLIALHLNDAQYPCGSHRDRHAAPGTGTIGEGLRRIIRHPAFARLPAILEIAIADVPAACAYLAG
jgi:deoxyribonuclease IV